jgi:hypothetical protein
VFEIGELRARDLDMSRSPHTRDVTRALTGPRRELLGRFANSLSREPIKQAETVVSGHG